MPQAIYDMPLFTTEPEARAMGAACGLRLLTFKLAGDVYAATFWAPDVEAVAALTADLSYGPTSVRMVRS